jgi:hypothetical protein
MKKLNAMVAGLAILAMAGTAGFVAGCKHMDSDEHGSAHVHTYTCPMHPEVVQDHPGNCSKCGMKLVHKD